MRDGAGFTQTLLYNLGAFGSQLLPVTVCGQQQVDIHFEAGDVLTETVMQPPCHLASFLILQGQNSTTQAMSGFFGTLAGGYICVDFQPSDGLTVLISHCSPRLATTI